MGRISDAFDTVIVGAGAAGLAAASELTSQGQSVCILEARPRVGGRVLTLHEAGVATPLELGAEFIHGESPAVFESLRHADDIAIDAPQTRWMLQDGRLQPGEAAFDVMKQGLQRLARTRADLPFAEFLDRHRRRLPGRVRSMAQMLVEGFDAADPGRASTLEILKEWGGNSAADAPTFRARRGYGALLDAMNRSLDPARAQLRLGTRVTELRWRRGAVTVHAERYGAPIQVRARQAIVTLPLSVMQLPATAVGAVRFVPELSDKRSALARLATGPVVKLLLRFSRPFWAELHEGRYRRAAFFLAPQAPLPTVWTTLPLRTPLLTVWAGGPKASLLNGKPTGELVRLALGSLALMFGRDVPYERLLEGVYWHDWQRDPFACGAYSYSLVGGAKARRALAQPLERTLFFAGEATDEEEAASVGGALNSGTQAARKLLESRPRNRRSK